MKKYLLFYLITVSLVLGLSVGAKAFTFTPFTVPGANGGTFAHGINNKGVVVGEWDVCCSSAHGFVRFPNGSFIVFDIPGARVTFANGINDNGDVVGYFVVGDFHFHGFLCPNNCKNPGAFLQIDFPKSLFTIANGINNKGEIVGEFSKVFPVAEDKLLGFYRSPSAFFSKISVPGAEGNLANGINESSQIVGECNSDIGGFDAGRSFLLASPFGIPQVSKFDPPGVVCTDCDRSEAYGINDSTVISGTFSMPL